MTDSIDIRGLNKVNLLEALWNATDYVGFNRNLPDFKFDRQEASTAVLDPIDYFCGKPMKCKLSGDSFNPDGYDRDAGRGKAAEIVRALRKQKYIQ